MNESNNGEAYIRWNSDSKNILYIDRLGVNANYLRQGIGSIMLEKVMNKECFLFKQQL